MDPREILDLYDRQQRRDIEYPDMHKEVRPHVVRFTRPAPGANHVLYSQLRGADIEAVITEEMAYFAALGQPCEWKVYDHDWPPDLKERLVAHGFELDEPEAIMALDIEGAPALLTQPVTADVRPVTDRQGLADVVQVLEAVWGEGFEWVYSRLGSHLEIPGYLNVYAAYVEGQPACAAWIYFHAGTQFASLWAGSTLPAFRQRGLYTAMLAVRLQAAQQRGFRFLTVDASPMSQPILARHGFQLLTYAHGCDFPKAV